MPRQQGVLRASGSPPTIDTKAGTKLQPATTKLDADATIEIGRDGRWFIRITNKSGHWWTNTYVTVLGDFVFGPLPVKIRPGGNSGLLAVLNFRSAAGKPPELAESTVIDAVLVKCDEGTATISNPRRHVSSPLPPPSERTGPTAPDFNIEGLASVVRDDGGAYYVKVCNESEKAWAVTEIRINRSGLLGGGGFSDEYNWVLVKAQSEHEFLLWDPGIIGLAEWSSPFVNEESVMFNPLVHRVKRISVTAYAADWDESVQGFRPDRSRLDVRTWEFK